MKKILTILASCIAITCARGAGIVSGTISANGSGGGGSATNISGGTFNNVTLNGSTVSGKVTATGGNTLTNSPVVELYQGNIAHIIKDSSSYWTSFPSSTTAGMNEIQALFPGDPTNGQYAGFHVKIAPGRFQFSSQIVISNSCIIEGSGPASTIFEYVGNTNFATVSQLTNILTAEPFAINAGRVSLMWISTNAQKVLGEDGVNYNVVLKNLSVVTKTNMFCVGITVSGGDSSIIDNVWVGGPQVFDSYNGFSGWVTYSDIPEPSKMVGFVLGANQPKVKDSRALGVACGLIVQGNSLSSLENFNAINCGVDVNQDGSSVFPLSSQLSLNAGVMMPLTTQCENLNIDRLLTYGCWIPVYIGAQPPVRISGWLDQSPNLNGNTIGVLTNCAARVEIVGGSVVNSLAVVKTNSNFTTDNTQNVAVTQWLSGNGQIESWNGYSFGSVTAGSFNGGTFTGNGSGLTNNQATISTLGPGSLVSSNQAAAIAALSSGGGSSFSPVFGNPEITITWNAGTITSNSFNSITAVFPGVKVNEPLSLVVPTNFGAGLVASVKATAADYITLQVANATTNPIVAGSGIYSVFRIKSDPVWIVPAATNVIPTNYLVAQFDMVTLTNSNTRLFDFSGHNTAADLTGTTSKTVGRAFNGSSDLVALPALVLSNNFTVLILAKSGNGVAAWSEMSTNGSYQFRMPAGIGGSANITGIGGSSSFGGTIPSQQISDWHLYYLQRAGMQATFGCLDLNFKQSVNLGNMSSLPSVFGTLGAQRWLTGTNVYWAGTNAYTLIYSGLGGCLPFSDLLSAYAGIRTNVMSRGIYLGDVLQPRYPSGIWQRLGVVCDPSGGRQMQDIKVKFSTNCVFVSNPGFMAVGDDGVNINYTESKDGIHWTDPILIIANKAQPGWMQDAATGKYYISCSPPIGSTTNLMMYVSTPNNPTNYTLLASNIVTSASSGAPQIYNSGLMQLGGTNYLLFDSPYYPGWTVLGATSMDFTNWVMSPANPLFGDNPDNLSGPEPHFINGKWYSWVHNVTAPPTGIFRVESATFDSIWKRTSAWGDTLTGAGIPVLSPAVGNESGQVASASLTEDNAGHTWLFYVGTGAEQRNVMKAAVCNLTLSQLVQTGEGATTDEP